MTDTFDVDVLVAGAGAAGLSAALAASESGAEVVVIEASESFRQGSNTAMSTSMIPAGGSRWQVRAGIKDSPDLFFQDAMNKSKGTANRVVTEALTAVAPKLVEWLVDYCAVPLELVTDFRYPGHSRDRCHAVPDRAGRTLHNALLRALDRSNVTLMSPMRLENAIVESGRVRAVKTSTPDGVNETIKTPNAVLATNGFAGNRSMVERLIPEIQPALYFGGEMSVGDAIRIGESLDADVDCLDAYQGHGSVATPHGVLVTWAVVMHGGFLVNKEGQRFGDESVGYSEYAVPVLQQASSTAWLVFDERIGRLCEPFRDFQDLIESGALKWAETIEDLAVRIGCSTAELGETFDNAQAAARGEKPDGFGRVDWGAPLSGPYVAVRVTGALFHTQGGLAVDEHARVTRKGEPITGLYAAGGAAVGMSGRGASGYMAGNGLLGALGLGFIAGRHAAKRTW